MKKNVFVTALLPFLAIGVFISALNIESGAASIEIPPSGDPKPTGEIKYINPDIPEVAPPNYSGKYYDALVPATLDLAERAKLAIHYMTESLNPNADYEPWDIGEQMADPPTLIIMNPLTSAGIYFEAVALLRTICGSRQNLDVDHFLMKKFLKMQGADGLIYVPTSGRNWVMHSWNQLFPKDFDGEQICVLGYGTGRFLPAFLLYEQMNRKGPWTEATRQLAEGFKKIFIEEDDAAYMFQHYTTPGLAVTKPETRPIGIIGFGGIYMVNSMIQYHRVHNDPDSMRIAAKMIRYALGDMNYYGENGAFLADFPGNNPWAHFHSHSATMVAGMDVVRQTGDKELLDRVLKAYEYGIKAGNGVVGFFPEAVHEDTPEFMGDSHPYKYHTSEACEVADMIRVGVMLANMGVKKSDGSDPWDDVDRWTRNQFVENQTTSIGWMTDGHIDYESAAPITQSHYDMFYKPGRPPFFGAYTTQNVAQRTLGSFASHPSANDYIGHPEFIVTSASCCTANSSRAIFQVWRDMLSYQDGTLRVNLLLNRASKWADVDSHIPYTGRVDVKMKKKLDLEIRIPEWVEPEDVACKVNDESREIGFAGRYAKIGKVKKGQTVVMTFPISERTRKVHIQGPPGGVNEYTLIIRGNTVVSIDPPGKYAPLYRRGHYRNGQTLYRKTTRFVSDENFGWW